MNAVYRAFCDYLQAPPLEVLTAERLLEILCPHAVLDDSTGTGPAVADRPAIPRPPQTANQASDLILPMSQILWGVCAATAAEMVLPIWYEFTDAAEQPLAVGHQPFAAIAWYWAWRHGQAPKKHLRDRIPALERLGQQVAPNDALYCVVQGVRNLCLSGISPAKGLEIPALHYFCEAVEFAEQELPPFLARWWTRCRCRLAVHDTASALLE